MRKTDITINARQYQLLCDDEQEDHIQYLSKLVDERASQLSQAVPRASESSSLVMTCLTIMDDLERMRDELHQLQDAMLQQHEQRLSDVLPEDILHAADTQLSGLLDEVAESLEQITHRLNAR